MDTKEARQVAWRLLAGWWPWMVLAAWLFRLEAQQSAILDAVQDDVRTLHSDVSELQSTLDGLQSGIEAIQERLNAH